MSRAPLQLPYSQSVGPRIRQFRTRRKLTQTKLARSAGINQGYLSEIEKGTRNPSVSTLRALAVALDVPEAVLVGQSPDHDAPQPLDTNEVPLFGTIPAGPPAQSQEQLEMFPVLRHLWGPDRYCLRLYHGSMEPTLKPGDIVLVHYRPDVNPEHIQGKICACLVDGNPTLKRVSVERKADRRFIVLRGDNPDTPPTVLDETADVSVQGVVISLVNRDL